MNPLRVRSWVVWMLCLGLLLPVMARAAPGISDEATEAPDQFLVDERERQAEAWWRRTDERRGPRLLGEVGAGLLTGVALGLVGGYVSGAFCHVIYRPEGVLGALACFPTAALGISVGLLLGVPLGVWWAGDALGGNGSLFATVGGGALGLASAFVVGWGASMVMPEFRDVEVVLAVSAPILALAGGVIGYEMSQKAPRWRAGRARFQPLVSITPRATVLGLSGAF